MPNYVPTNWADGVTPVDEAHLDNLEAGVLAAVPRDGSVAAVGNILANKLLAGDAQAAYRSFGDGKQQWGPGGATAPDTALYRVSAGNLRIDNDLTVYGYIELGSYREAGNYGVVIRAQGDVGFRTFLTNDGKLGWGDGSGYAADTSLYRSGAGQLRTAGGFVVDQALYVGYNPPGLATMYFGPAADTNLYRSAANTLKTDGNIIVGSALQAGSDLYSLQGGAGTVRVGMLDPASAGSPNTYVGLYYDAANTIARLDALAGGVAWRDVAIARNAYLRVDQGIKFVDGSILTSALPTEWFLEKVAAEQIGSTGAWATFATLLEVTAAVAGQYVIEFGCIFDGGGANNGKIGLSFNGANPPTGGPATSSPSNRVIYMSTGGTWVRSCVITFAAGDKVRMMGWDDKVSGRVATFAGRFMRMYRINVAAGSRIE